MDDPRLHLIWVGLANSLVFDWIARRRISTTLNFFHLKEMPFPMVDVEHPLAKQLCYRVAQLTDTEIADERLLQWLESASDYRRTGRSLEEDRVKTRIEIDALGLLFFQVTEREFFHLCKDFKTALDRLGGNKYIDQVIACARSLSSRHKLENLSALAEFDVNAERKSALLRRSVGCVHKRVHGVE